MWYMTEFLDAAWRYEGKLYIFHGRKPTIYEAFEGLGYSIEDSKILEKYCAYLYCKEEIRYRMVIIYNNSEDYLIKDIINNNKNIIYRGVIQIVYLINR